MLAASRDVLLRPTVRTFEAHERGSLGAALLYVALGATISALLGVVGFYLKRPFLGSQYGKIGDQLERFQAQTGIEFPLASIFAPPTAAQPVLTSALGALVGFLVYIVVVFALGRALGGSGRIGELAYNVALFWVPITIASAVLDLGTISFFSCLSAPLVILVTIYGLYLTYVSVQAGMNLPGRRALLVIAIPALLYVLAACALLVLAFALIELTASPA